MRRTLSVFSIFLSLFILILTSYPLPTQTLTWSSLPPESFHYSLTWPTAVRAGEPRATVLHIQSSSAFPPGTVFQARLEFPGLQTIPGGAVSVPSGESDDIAIRWKVLPVVPGRQSGTLWLYSSAADGSRQLLFSRSLQIRLIYPGRISFLAIRWIAAGLFIPGAIYLSLSCIRKFHRAAQPR